MNINDIAGKITDFCGSVKFLLCLNCFLFIWCIVGQTLRFDSYPFVFLNLILGIFLAEANVFIMISQNKQSLEQAKMIEKIEYHVEKSELIIQKIEKLELIQEKELENIEYKIDHKNQ